MRETSFVKREAQDGTVCLYRRTRDTLHEERAFATNRHESFGLPLIFLNENLYAVLPVQAR